MKTSTTLSPQVLQAFEKVPDLYLILSPQLVILTASDAYLAATHTVRKEIAGKYLFDVFPESPAAKEIRTTKHLRESLQQVLATKRPHRMGLQHYALANEGQAQRYWKSANTPVLDEQGEVQYIIHKLEGVTERRQAEQQIQQSHDLLQATINSSLDMIQVFEAVRNTEGEIVDFTWVLNNGVSEKVYGNIIGQRLLKCNPGVVKEGIFDTFKRVVETGIPDQRERHYVHEQFNGWFYQSTVKLNDGVATTTRDITELKRAEQELQQSKQLLQDIINAPNIGIAVYKAVRSEKGDIVDFVHEYINRTSLKMLGGEDFTGKPFTAHGENALVQLPRLIEVLKSGKDNSYVREANFRGKRVWFAITNTPLDKDRLVHTWEDVTERKNTEQENLQLKEEISRKAIDKYKTLFNNVDEGFAIQELVLDKNGMATDLIYQEVNQAFEKHTGMKNVVGKKLSELIPHLEQDWLDTLTWVCKTGEPVRDETYVADLNRWISFNYSRVGGPGSRLISSVFNDITERKRRERRQEFLLKFSDTLRTLSDEKAIEETALRMLAEFLELDRAYVFVLYPVDDRAVIRAEYRIDSLISILGEVRMSDFPETVRQIEDETIVFNDIDNDARLSELNRASLHAVNLQAFICASVRKGERNIIWSLAAATFTPRVWAKDEVELIEIVAERIWAAVERAKAEKALYESEERFRNLIESYAQAVWEANPTGEVVADSPTWRAYTGHTVDEWLGYGWVNAIHPDDRAYAERQWREAVASRSLVDATFRLKHAASGGYRWTNMRAIPILDEDGSITKWVGMNIDIDEQKKAEEVLANYNTLLEQQVSERTQALVESKAFAEQVVEATPDFVFILNLLTNKIEFVSRKPYFGDEERYQETIFSDLEAILNRAHPDDREKLRRFVDSFRATSDNEAQSLEYRVVRSENVSWYRTRAKVFRRDEAGTPTHYISIVQDISKVKQLEEENLQMRLNQQKSLLIAILDAQEEERRRISEALHNGVGQLLYAAKIHLGRHRSQGQPDKPNTGSPLTQADQILEQAITETRSLSHELTPLVLEQFGLEMAIKEICTSVSSSKLNLQCNVAQLPRNLDRHLMIATYRIAQELATNIIKHASATQASLQLQKRKNMLVLQVQDNGQGFETSPMPPVGGIGLGAIKDRVKLLNGTIKISSKPGNGALIKITLPFQ